MRHRHQPMALTMSHRILILIPAMVLLTGALGLLAQVMTPATLPASTATVRGHVQVIGAERSGKKRHEAIPTTVVWLTPISSAEIETLSIGPRSSSTSPASPQLVQKNKSFQPHILVVPAGSEVEFPNRDPFFHNVFSLFEGK